MGYFAVVVALPLVFAPFTAAQFLDIKYVVLLAGVLLVSISRPRVDRLLAVLAASWVATLVLATVLGLDPWWSLLGPENRGTGLLSLAASAFLLCAGTNIDDDLRSRIPSWLFWTGVAMSGVSIVGRFFEIGGESWELGALSSTMGHRVFAGGFIAASVVAAVAVRPRPVTWLGVLVLGSGLAVTAARSAWIGAALGLCVVVLRDRRWKVLVGVLVPLTLALVAWTLIDRTIAEEEKEIGFSAAGRFLELDEGSASERIPGFRANLRAWADDPVLGTGPGTGWYGYLTHVNPEEFRRAGRGFADAHNLLIEIGTTSGTIGAIGFVALGFVVLVRALRAPKPRAWALGVALALGVVHMLQPLNLVLTPLMFLTAGMAASGSDRPKVSLRTSRWVAVLAAVGLLLVTARFMASSFERYGGAYASETALRWALRFEPRRLASTIRLARHRAFDHRTADPTGANDARKLVRRAVNQHPWYPHVRLYAADIVLIFEDEDLAERYVDEHLEIFPNDPAGLAGASALALRRGDRADAISLARRALRIDPDHPGAEQTLRSAKRKD